MTFIKKNLLKMILGALVLTGIVFALIVVFRAIAVMSHDGVDALTKADKSEVWSFMLRYAATAISLLAVFAIVILKIINKGEKAIPFMAIAGGGIALIVMITALIVGREYFIYYKKTTEDTLEFVGKNGFNYIFKLFAASFLIADKVIYMLIACAPIFYGCKKLLKAKAKAKENTPT